MITLGLLLMMLGIVITLHFVQNNYLLIIYASLFSFAAACLYFVNAAPDLALAEIAVGCAFIPLIFTIAIMRQNTFTVVFFSQEGEQAYCDPDILIEFMAIAEIFCAAHQLKLKLVTHPTAYEPSVRGIFRLGNTDLIANYFEDAGVLHLWGNMRNKLIPELAEALSKSSHFHFEAMGGEWVEE